MLLFYSNVSNFTQNVVKVFQLAQIWWRLLELPHDSSSLKGSVYFAIRGKREWQNSLRLLIWLLFCRNLQNRHCLITCECSCILCPNFQIFWTNNCQFFSIRDVTASPASPCHALMHCSHQNFCGCCCEIKVSLYSLQNYVEARYEDSGKRSHKPKCTRSRRFRESTENSFVKNFKKVQAQKYTGNCLTNALIKSDV